MKRVAIIGGGFCGLGCATQLVKKGYCPDIYESKPVLGGLAAGFQEAGWKSSLEIFYHHWFDSDRVLKEFVETWEAEKNLFFRAPLTVVETKKNGFVALDSPLSLLGFPELKLHDKLRMGVVLAFLRSVRNGTFLEKHTAHEWCLKYMGQAGYQAIWQPLLEGKFGPEWSRQVNMAWLWARLASRTKKLGSFKGGFSALVRRAEEYLLERDVDIQKNCGELSLTPSNHEGWKVRSPEGEKEYDAVVVAASPFSLNKILGKTLSFVEKPFLSARVVILSLKTPLAHNGPYWYSLKKTKNCPFIALIEHTQFVPAAEFGGEHLVYVADYADPNHKMTESEYVHLALECCKKTNPAFRFENFNRHWFFEESYAQPIPLLNASQSLPPLRVPDTKNLYFASMAHVYPWDRGTNYALELGKKVADMISQKR